MSKIYLILLLWCATGIFEVGSRRYDIEGESQKLFGESLDTVLKRFRRSPDYLKILHGKLSSIHEQYGYIIRHTMHYYQEKLKERFREMYNVGREGPPESPDTAHKFLRQMGEIPEKKLLNFFGNKFGTFTTKLHKKKHAHRQGDAEEPQSLTGVEILDNYITTNTLSVQEKKVARDIGFETAGLVIHAVIKHMGVDESAHKSTRQIAGNEDGRGVNQKPTTEHVHEITAGPGQGGHNPELTGTSIHNINSMPRPPTPSP